MLVSCLVCCDACVALECFLFVMVGGFVACCVVGCLLLCCLCLLVGSGFRLLV